MNDAAKKPETIKEPGGSAGASARQQKYGGRNRWIFTFAAGLCFTVTAWLWHRKSPEAVITMLSGFVITVAAVINWCAWWKKSEAERKAERWLPLGTLLEIKPLSVPFTRADFEKARQSAHLNLAITAIAMLYLLIAVLSLFAPQTFWEIRLIALAIGIPAGYAFFYCGKRFWHSANTFLSCPGCKDLLTSQADHILKTGCCRRCNKTILLDASEL